MKSIYCKELHWFQGVRCLKIWSEANVKYFQVFYRRVLHYNTGVSTLHSPIYSITNIITFSPWWGQVKYFLIKLSEYFSDLSHLLRFIQVIIIMLFSVNWNISWSCLTEILKYFNFCPSRREATAEYLVQFQVTSFSFPVWSANSFYPSSDDQIWFIEIPF